MYAIKVVFLTIIFVVISGCLSYSDYAQDLQSAVLSNSPSVAEKKLANHSQFSKTGKNKLLHYLEYSMIQMHLNQYKNAIKSLHKASDLANELYTVSLSKTALSFVINDSSQDYAGEEYELIAIHTMLAILYIKLGKMSEALVEARRINSKMRQLNMIKKDYACDGLDYHIDAFSLFLSGLIFELSKEYDSAIVDYSKAMKAYECYAGVRVVPKSLVISLWTVALKKNRTVILAKLAKNFPQITSKLAQSTKQLNTNGSIVLIALGNPVMLKRSKTFVIGLGDEAVRYSWPSIPNYSRSFINYNPRINNKSIAISLQIVQDYDAIARIVLEQKRLKLTAKSIARIIAKKKIANQAARANPLLGLAIDIIGILFETADTRSWSLLPAKIAISRSFYAKGTYDLKYVNSSDQVSKKINLSSKNPLVISVLDY